MLFELVVEIHIEGKLTSYNIIYYNYRTNSYQLSKETA